MKKLFYLGGILAAMLSLTNCAKEIDAPEVNEGYKIELSANSAVSKTWNENLKTVWGSSDALTVFYAEAGTESYSPNLKFKIVDTLAGRFECVLPDPLTKEVYDWYAQYPYSSYVKTPANTESGYITVGSKTSTSQLQENANSMSHIAGENYPLFGKVAGVVSGETPKVVMSHATSLLEIVVKNQSTKPVNVSSLSFTAPEDVVGTYYIDFTGDELVYTPSGANYVSKVATLTVNPAVEVAAGESSKFYLAIKPFSAEAGATLGLALNGADAKENTLAAAMEFNAGVINTLNYTIAADEVIEEPKEIVATVAEFLEAADGFNTYILTGKITSVVNTTYGNFYLEDATGVVYIYGLCSPEGETKYWAESGVKQGDIITVKGSYTLYGTTPEIVDAIYVSHVPAQEPVEGFVEGDYWMVADGHYAMPVTGNYGYLQVGDAGSKDNVFTFTAVDGGFTIQQSDGKYLYMTGNYNNYNVSATIPSEGHIWSVEENEESTLVITNVMKEKTVQYDQSYNSYGAYSDVRGIFPKLVDASSAR